MFRSTIIIRSLQLSLAKFILILKHSVRLGRNFTECCNIKITLARLNCKTPDDGVDRNM